MADFTREITAWPSVADSADPAPSRLAVEVTGLFHELRVPLLRYLLSFGLPLSDGEDIVQEVFLSLFRHLQQNKSRANLRGWIFRVGHNLALKRRMQNGRAVENSELENQDRVDPSPDPEQQLSLSRKQAQLLTVVRSLPERDRWCLSLRAEGLRYREIADALDMSLGGVALSLSRSLAKLSSINER